MNFELAKKLIKEIDRVTKKYFYLSLILQKVVVFLIKLKIKNYLMVN